MLAEPLQFSNKSKCLWCGSSLDIDQKKILTKDHANKGVRLYGYLRCNNCHSWSLINPPVESEMYLCYPPNYEPYKTTKSWEDVAPLVVPCDAFSDRFSINQSFGILDFGAGSGKWLASAAKAFPNSSIYAVDFDASVLKERLSWLGKEVNFCLPSHFDSLTDPLGWINFSHSLEHVDNPVKVLSKAFDLLIPGGLISIALPVSNSLSMSLFKGYWFAFEAPRHLSIPSKLALMKVLSRLGFELISSRSYGSPSVAIRSAAYLQHFSDSWLANSLLVNVFNSCFSNSYFSKLVGDASDFVGFSSKYSILLRKPID